MTMKMTKKAKKKKNEMKIEWALLSIAKAKLIKFDVFVSKAQRVNSLVLIALRLSLWKNQTNIRFIGFIEELTQG